MPAAMTAPTARSLVLDLLSVADLATIGARELVEATGARGSGWPAGSPAG